MTGLKKKIIVDLHHLVLLWKKNIERKESFPEKYGIITQLRCSKLNIGY